MKYQEVKKLIPKYISPFFIKEGFEDIFIDSYGVCFTRRNSSIECKIELRKLNYGHILLQAGQGEITFYSVENAIKNISEKYKLRLGDVTYGQYDTSDIAIQFASTVSDSKIENEGTFKDYAEKLKSWIIEFIFPFFKTYSDLTKVAIFVENLEHRENLSHFGGEYPINAFKSMYIIYCYGSREKYESLKAYVKKGIKSYDNREEYKDFYEASMSAFHEFTTKLESGELN